MTALRIQRAIAAVFVVLGGWALLMPQQVIDLTIRQGIAQGGRLETFAVACFGAQALISGLFAASARFTRTTILAYGIALLPFFAFNYWFYFIDPIFTAVGLLDLLGNAVMLVLCVWGWKVSEPATPPA